MTFENPELKTTQSVEESPDSKIESTFGRLSRCFKRWGDLGMLVGGILVVGGVAEYKRENDSEYNSYVASLLSGEKSSLKVEQDNELRNIFGDSAVADIDFGDREAFFERQEKIRDEPRISGVAEQGYTNIATYSFTEKHLLYPKRWVAGEIGEVKFIDEFKGAEDGGHNLGGEVRQNIVAKPTMYLYRSHQKVEGKANHSPIDQKTIAHELGHANDWETDMDLNILERQELLSKVYKRMNAPDAFHRDGDQYHETFLDGSKEGAYKAAREYWAEICGEYFSNPEYFLEKQKEDFELVDAYAKRNDPAFDIFNKNRGAFDTDTGELKEVWKR